MPKPDPIAVVRTDFANTGPNRNGEPIVAAINGLNTYSQDSIIFRQSSATSLPDNTDVSGFNLHPGSVVRLANDGVTLLTPDFIPPFTDGGYYAEDTISYNSIAEAGQVFRNIPTENLSLTSTGNQRFIGVSNNTSSTSFPFTYPSAPFGLTYRMRAIVRAGDASIEFEHRDEFDRYSGKSVVSVETFGTRKDLLCYLPDEDPELDADARANYRLEDIGSRVVDTSV
ncbi:MAG: hypothetical protein K0U41_09970, partial [Gammaproteobacteria bacterium]|nr:hypothetical protein [Gammaproteobacteria bacterium]